MISALTRPVRQYLDPRLLSGVMVVGTMTIAVKGMAFLKEMTVAHRFGTSNEVDAFLLAILIPTIVAFIVGDALHDSVLPAYAERRVQDRAGARQLISNVVWIAAGALFLVSLGALLLDRTLIDLLARNFSPEKKERSAELLRLLFPFAISFGVGAIFKGYLQAHRRFALAAAAPAIVPAVTILVLLLSPGKPSANLLAAGASIGGILFVVILCAGARKIHRGRLLTRPRWDEPTRAVVQHAVPLLAGAALMEGCFFIDTMMAASLPAGSVAVLSYGERICSIVLAIGGTAAGQVLFPHVSDLAARKEWKALRRVVYRFSGLILALALPAVLFFWFTADFVVRLLLERGAFTAEDTGRVAEVLRFAGLQIPGYILAVLGARVIMALRANYLMLLTTVLAIGLNIGLNLLFIRWFGVKGIALSTAAVSAGSAVLLFTFFTFRLKRLAANAST